MGSAPHATSKAWDAFYRHWVHPVIHFGTPTLVVLAVLMTPAVVVTPLVVRAHTPGTRSAGSESALSGAYWFGVICLLFSAIEATIVFPLSRHIRWARPESWAAVVSIGLIAVALIVVVALLTVDRPPLRGLIDACQPPDGNGATGAVFLPLQAELDSVPAVRDALKPPGKLREDLLSRARDWAVVAPGKEEAGTWGRHLRVRQH